MIYGILWLWGCGQYAYDSDGYRRGRRRGRRRRTLAGEEEDEFQNLLHRTVAGSICIPSWIPKSSLGIVRIGLAPFTYCAHLQVLDYAIFFGLGPITYFNSLLVRM